MLRSLVGSEMCIRDRFNWSLDQTPIKLAKFLHDNKLPILGTQYTSIDLTEDRDRFRDLLNKLKLKQAESGIAKTFKQAIQIADKIGLPLMVRPSYVLGGRAMEIVHEKRQLKNFVEEAFRAAEENPILIDTGGKLQAESPECIPASSICCIIPATKTSLPSDIASTSTSMA